MVIALLEDAIIARIEVSFTSRFFEYDVFMELPPEVIYEAFDDISWLFLFLFLTFLKFLLFGASVRTNHLSSCLPFI
jgi:hypothetical protein